jgi:hypothetical protein
VLDWWFPQVQACLRGKLHAVVLFGSVTLDDFCPGWSDVDVCVVVNQPVSETEGKALGEIHDRMRDLFIRTHRAGWASGQAIGGYYIPRELVTDSDRKMPCYTAGGTTRRWAQDNPVSPFDRYMLAHFGSIIAGEDTKFAPPSDESLVTQARADIAQLRESDPAKQSSIWLCGMFHWLARSLVFWREGTMISKSAALKRGIDTNSKYADAFLLALEIRQRGSAAAAAQHEILLQNFEKHALPCADELESLIEQTVLGRRLS